MLLPVALTAHRPPGLAPGAILLITGVGGQALEEVAPLLAGRRKPVGAGDRAAAARLGGSSVARARTQEVLDTLAQLVIGGALRPHVTHTFPLAQAAQHPAGPRSARSAPTTPGAATGSPAG